MLLITKPAKITRLLFCVLLFYPLISGAQLNHHFENAIHIKCPLGYISDIVRDDNHFLWIGGDGGLLRYDGLQFKHYLHNPADSLSIMPGYISRFYYEKDKEKLWMAFFGNESKGFSVLDLRTEKFSNFPSDLDNSKGLPAGDINWIFKDHWGYFWFSVRGYGLTRLDTESNTYENVTYQPTPQEDGLSMSLHNRFDDFSHDIHNDSIIWLASGSGLLRFNLVTHQYRKYFSPDKYDETSMELRSVLHHSNGKVYAGTRGGTLLELDTLTRQLVPAPLDRYTSQNVHFTAISSIVSKSKDRLLLTVRQGMVDESGEKYTPATGFKVLQKVDKQWKLVGVCAFWNYAHTLNKGEF
ncbi:MAG TPA: hypothetical protein PKA00_23090 [Saprospiraceae bacterium]|nr:hypothetical protein [Saprospiraceae bacterium]HMQ85814.1 hypothetical protein [Saprospiraceae bacterium]